MFFTAKSAKNRWKMLGLWKFKNAKGASYEA